MSDGAVDGDSSDGSPRPRPPGTGPGRGAVKTETFGAVCAATGFNRDHARRALQQALRPRGVRPRPPRAPNYARVVAALEKCWAVENAPTGKWLAPILAELGPVGKLDIDDDTAPHGATGIGSAWPSRCGAPAGPAASARPLRGATSPSRHGAPFMPASIAYTPDVDSGHFVLRDADSHRVPSRRCRPGQGRHTTGVDSPARTARRGRSSSSAQ